MTVATGTSAPIELEIDGTTHGGSLLAIDVRQGYARITIAFEAATAPVPAMDAAVQLRLPASTVVLGKALPGRVVEHWRRAEREQFVVEVRGPLPEDIGSCHGRQAFRVAPSATERPRALLSAPDGRGRRKVDVGDVSLLGASVTMPDDVELCCHRQLVLELELPGSEHRVLATAHVRRRRLKGKVVAYGLEFDASAPADFTAAIARYVMDRQRTMLR